MKIGLLILLLMTNYLVVAQLCGDIDNRSVGSADAKICFFNSSGTSMGSCLDCQQTGSKWKCGSGFNAYVNYYSATIGGGAPCYRVIVPLPIELTAFYAEIENNKVNVFWETSSETSSDYFEIYRINNISGESEVLAKIAAAGNSNTKIEYLFLDEYPQNGINYYILKQFDLNGDSQSYDAISIELRQENKPVFYPNPLVSNTIYWSSLESIHSVSIYTTDGKQIGEVQSGIHSFTFENTLQSIYIFKVALKDGTEIFYKIFRQI
jgi:hypothetical protein